MATVKKYNKLKLNISKYLLKRKLAKLDRHCTTCSIDKAKTVGVSFVINNPSDLDAIKIQLKKLSDKGLQVHALGYIPNKKPDDFYLSQKSFNFFSDKDLDFYLRPKSIATDEFMEKSFDILIDINSNDYYPMHYLLALSNARFKVGRFGEDKPYDLMMNIEEGKDLDYYFDQVLHYLSMIN